jgi:hypothetical protein
MGHVLCFPLSLKPVFGAVVHSNAGVDEHFHLFLDMVHTHHHVSCTNVTRREPGTPMSSLFSLLRRAIVTEAMRDTEASSIVVVGGHRRDVMIRAYGSNAMQATFFLFSSTLALSPTSTSCTRASSTTAGTATMLFVFLDLRR